MVLHEITVEKEKTPKQSRKKLETETNESESTEETIEVIQRRIMRIIDEYKRKAIKGRKEYRRRR